MSTTENTTPPVEENVEKTSKLRKVKGIALAAGIYGIPTAVGVASAWYSYKITKMNYEMAKLNLEKAQEEAAAKE